MADGEPVGVVTPRRSFADWPECEIEVSFRDNGLLGPAGGPFRWFALLGNRRPWERRGVAARAAHVWYEQA